MALVRVGFLSIASEPKGSTACVNLLFKEWTLDTEVKYAFTCIGVFLLGILMQYLIKAHTLIRHAQYRQVIAVAVYDIQVVLGYFRDVDHDDIQQCGAILYGVCRYGSGLCGVLSQCCSTNQWTDQWRPR